MYVGPSFFLSFFFSADSNVRSFASFFFKQVVNPDDIVTSPIQQAIDSSSKEEVLRLYPLLKST